MKRWMVVVGLALSLRLGGTCRTCHDDDAAIRVATFNIEDFPKHGAQVDGAFAELAVLDASIVALQEITDPALFAREASLRLGAHWRSVFVATRIAVESVATRVTKPVHHLGVLFDVRQWTFVEMRTHADTQLDGRHKPTLEVALRDRRGAVVRVLVVHLKAGADGRDIRARQYTGLARLIARVKRSGDRVVVLGDFNATDERDDRADLAALARATGLPWATEQLACSAFWKRDDGCFRSRLDHAFAWAAPSRIELGGACATHGCDREDRCPVYVERVSDHCPVVIELR